MTVKSQLFTALSTIFIAFNSFAADNVAKVVVMRGLVKAKLIDGTIIDVKTDQSIPEGAVVQTAEKSFVKLLFIDKSQMNLGPNSQMIINSFPKKEAGIITLVKGQIRSQVTKDYMEMDDKSKSKLYIKTKTAAMGIRGTDFQVNYNPQNQNTSLITFEGKVAMAHISKNIREDRFDQQNLERVVSSDKAVFVTQGQVSAVNLNVAERAMVPTKLGTKQIEALEGNETGIKESSGTDSEKQFRNPIPPGAEGVAFSSASPELDKEVSKMGVTVKAVPTTFNEKSAAPEGFFNNDTGEYKLPDGSIIDLSTVNIIPPPTNAVFDNNSGTYVVPETFGKIDKITGEYKAPAGLELGADGKFTVVDADAFKKAQEPSKDEKKEEDKKEESKDTVKKEGDVAAAPAEGTDGRAPASVSPPTDLKVPVVFAGEAAQAFILKNADPVLRAPAGTVLPPNIVTDLAAKAAAIIQKNDVAKQTATDRGVIYPATSRVKFIFNAP
jgi:hypothetical protein